MDAAAVADPKAGIVETKVTKPKLVLNKLAEHDGEVIFFIEHQAHRNGDGFFSPDGGKTWAAEFKGTNGFLLHGSSEYPQIDRSVIYLRGASETKDRQRLATTLENFKHLALAVAEYNAVMKDVPDPVPPPEWIAKLKRAARAAGVCDADLKWMKPFETPAEMLAVLVHAEAKKLDKTGSTNPVWKVNNWPTVWDRFCSMLKFLGPADFAKLFDLKLVELREVLVKE